MSGETPVLRFRGLRKTLGRDRRLLDIEELTIDGGTCTMISGPNGAGKTTLLKIIGALDRPDCARVDYGGRSLPWSVARRRFRHDVIYLHQQAYLFDCSVADNVAYGLRQSRRPRAELESDVERALRWAGLEHLAPRNARELSGGERQRVALTRAFVLAPRVLLLDEPFAGLDEDSRQRTCQLIRRLTAAGVAVVLTSHETLWLAGVVDRHLELRDGRLAPAAMRPSIPGAPGAGPPDRRERAAWFNVAFNDDFH